MAMTTSLSSDDKEFDFLYSQARRIILNIESIKERIVGAKWLRFLKQADDPLRKDYLKMLIVCAHKKQFHGPFAENPPNTLTPFKGSENVFEFCKNYLMSYHNKPLDNGNIVTAVSGNLREYVAMQPIKDFGVHCYFASSQVALPHWVKSKMGNYPSPDVEDALPWEASFANKKPKGHNLMDEESDLNFGMDKQFKWARWSKLDQKTITEHPVPGLHENKMNQLKTDLTCKSFPAKLKQMCLVCELEAMDNKIHAINNMKFKGIKDQLIIRDDVLYSLKKHGVSIENSSAKSLMSKQMGLPVEPGRCWTHQLKLRKAFSTESAK